MLLKIVVPGTALSQPVIAGITTTAGSWLGRDSDVPVDYCLSNFEVLLKMREVFNFKFFRLSLSAAFLPAGTSYYHLLLV